MAISALPEKSFDELVSDQVNAMQAVSQKILDFNEGSFFRALVESNAGNGIWLESLVAFLLSVTRLQTSYGKYADTFVQQFGLSRIPAIPAFGLENFFRTVADQPAVIPAGDFDTNISQGALVYSSTNQVKYSVYADSSNPFYNPDLQSYVIPIGTQSADLPIVALTAGSIGNIAAGFITTIQTPIAYIDSVTNSLPLNNGQNQESDAALKVRFVLYLNSLSKACKQAVEAYVADVPGVARSNVVENKDVDGNDQLGFFYVVIDDGSGNASSELLGNVQAVVYPVRGLTIAFSIYAPIQVQINITAHVYTDGSIDDGIVQTAVISALQNYILSIGFDGLYAWSDIPRVIYEVNQQFSNPQSLSPILNVKDWIQNGGNSDILVVNRQIGIPGTITVIMNA